MGALDILRFIIIITKRNDPNLHGHETTANHSSSSSHTTRIMQRSRGAMNLHQTLVCLPVCLSPTRTLRTPTSPGVHHGRLCVQWTGTTLVDDRFPGATYMQMTPCSVGIMNRNIVLTNTYIGPIMLIILSRLLMRSEAGSIKVRQMPAVDNETVHGLRFAGHFLLLLLFLLLC